MYFRIGYILQSQSHHIYRFNVISRPISGFVKQIETRQFQPKVYGGNGYTGRNHLLYDRNGTGDICGGIGHVRLYGDIDGVIGIILSYDVINRRAE